MINLHFFIPLNGYNIMPPRYTHKMAIVSDHGFCDVTSHYVLIFASALCLVVCSLQVLPRPQIRQSAQLVWMVTLRLTPVLTTDRVSGVSNALGRVRPSARFCSWLLSQLTFIFAHAWVTTIPRQKSKVKVIGEGQGLRLGIASRVMRSDLDPRSGAVCFLVLETRKKEKKQNTVLGGPSVAVWSLNETT